MATLYLTEQGTTLRKEGRRFVIERDGIALGEIHEFKVERIVIFGHVQLTTQAISYMLNRSIDTAFISLQGRLKGRLTPLASKNILLRLRQYERARDANFAISLARSIVSGKIANCVAVLARHQRNHPEVDFSEDIDRLNIALADAARKQTLASLRGVEGQAAAIYFRAFASMLRRELCFTKRTRRPPADPVNSMLSFGYTLLYNEAISAVVSVGFDPYIGFFHGINYGRCSLALDLMEEFRCLIVDRLAKRMANLEILKEEDFIKEGEGTYLKAEARGRFLKEYEKVMNSPFRHSQTSERTTFRQALHNQVLLFERAIMGKGAYYPFQGWR